MNLKKISTSFPLVLIMLILMETNFAYSQNLKLQNQKINEVIDSSMELFLYDIPENLLINYGIKNKAEIKKATIGNPIAVYTIENDSLIFTNTWRIPLIIDNEYKALFTVFKNNDDEYKIVDFGAVLLAQEFLKFSKENDFSAMLRVYKLRKDFFICENNKGEFKYKSIPSQDNKEYTFNDLIEMLK